jgi:transposase-like protein
MERKILISVVICPKCQSAWLRARGKKKPEDVYAWYKCLNCGESFRSKLSEPEVGKPLFPPG